MFVRVSVCAYMPGKALLEFWDSNDVPFRPFRRNPNIFLTLLVVKSFDISHPLQFQMLRNAGGERPKRSHEEAMFFNMYRMRPTSTSHILHPPSGSRTDATVSKWERTIPLNVVPTVQYPPRAGQVAPFGCQVPSNRFKDANAGPSVISQAAADEGSRTGIKGSGILSSINARSVVSDRSPSEMLLTGTKQKSGIHNSEPESSTPSR